MALSLKDLIVVLALSTIVFMLVKSTALLFCDVKDFVRRRIAFYVLTCAGFLCPSFWVYAVIAVPTLLIVGRRDSNPVAVYLFLLYVIPPATVPTPIFGMRSLMDFNNQVLLSLLVVIPAIWHRRKSQNIIGITFADWCFLAYGVLTSALYLHVLQPNGIPYPSTATDFLRRVVVFMIVGFAPYFLISRSSVSRQAILDSVSALLIPCIVMSVIGIFEGAKGWLLYEVIPQKWGTAASFGSYLVRAGSLRAMASSGHPLALGYLLDIAFGIWLALSRYVPSQIIRMTIPSLIGLGLLASYSRGPWACAILIYFAFALQKPQAFSSIAKALLGAGAAAVLLAFSPVGTRIAAVVPFLGGNVGAYNISYRELLWSRAWMLFQQSPIFGNQLALTKMQDLRQGQGIVDFVNGYALEMVSSGSIGLGLFFVFILAILWQIQRTRKEINLVDKSFGMVGASLASCILGTMFLWALGGPSDTLLWTLLAFGLGYAHIAPAVHRVFGTDALIQPKKAPNAYLPKSFR